MTTINDDMYVIYRNENNNEAYLTKAPAKYDLGVSGCPTTAEVGHAMPFQTAREAYDFAKQYYGLQTFRVGRRKWAGTVRKPFSKKLTEATFFGS